MSTNRRAMLRRLAATAFEMKLDVMDGALTRGEDGRWLIGKHDLLTWLERHSGEDVVLVLGALEDDRPMEVRTCRTCGRDYQDIECPTCRANRMRLRGRA